MGKSSTSVKIVGKNGSYMYEKDFVSSSFKICNRGVFLKPYNPCNLCENIFSNFSNVYIVKNEVKLRLI